MDGNVLVDAKVRFVDNGKFDKYLEQIQDGISNLSQIILRYEQPVRCLIYSASFAFISVSSAISIHYAVKTWHQISNNHSEKRD